MRKKKSPYIGYTLEEVKTMEDGYFVLKFGGDFVIQDKFYLFTKNEVYKLYDKTLRDLIGIVADGNAKDRKYALELIAGLSVQPMRLH